MAKSIAVLGMPGHGKSTVLNALFPEGPRFAMASGKESCTKKVAQESFPVEGTPGAQLTLVDTMGWPDPNPEHAAEFYDQVVTEAINRFEGLNAIVWVYRPEVGRKDLVDPMYKPFMSEFAAAQVPIILLINDAQNYKLCKGAAKEKKMAEDRANALAHAQKLLCESGLESRVGNYIIYSPNLDWLADEDGEFIKELLITIGRAGGMHPKRCAMRTFAQIVAKFRDAKTAEEESKRDSARRIADLKQDIEAAHAEKAAAATGVGVGSGLAATAGAGLAAAWVVSGFFTGGVTWAAGAAAATGVAAGAIATGVAVGGVAYAATGATLDWVASKEKELAALQDEASRDAEYHKKRAQQAKAEFDKLAEYLGQQ